MPVSKRRYWGEAFWPDLRSSAAREKLKLSKLFVAVVDMQPGQFGYRSNDLTQNLVRKQQALLGWAVENQIPVTFFQRQGKGQTISELISRMRVDNVWDCVDYSGKSFLRDNLGELSQIELTRHPAMRGRTSMILAGIGTSSKIKQTILDALLLDLDVISAEDLHGDLYACRLLDKPGFVPVDQTEVIYDRTSVEPYVQPSRFLNGLLLGSFDLLDPVQLKSLKRIHSIKGDPDFSPAATLTKLVKSSVFLFDGTDLASTRFPHARSGAWQMTTAIDKANEPNSTKISSRVAI